MLSLLVVSILWAFSFGLIKTQLAGIDPNLLAFLRLALAAAVFLPMVRLHGLSGGFRTRLIALGGLQFGVMYVAVMHAYRFLPGYQVAVLTIFTPLWVALIEDLLRRSPTPKNYAGAALAVVGAGVIVFQGGGAAPAWIGVLLVQVANIAFAAGQVLYRRMRIDRPDRRIFALLYLGGMLVAGISAAFTVRSVSITPTQGWTIAYLGVIASGLGFFLWNRGARQVPVSALAAWNNGYIPLAVAASLVVFGEPADLRRLLAGSVLIAAGLLLSHRMSGSTAEKPA